MSPTFCIFSLFLYKSPRTCFATVSSFLSLQAKTIFCVLKSLYISTIWVLKPFKRKDCSLSLASWYWCVCACMAPFGLCPLIAAEHFFSMSVYLSRRESARK
ncbi:hypothetical protein [Bufonid herpesvirus 1]|uniref:hypothetical protein n=1 Tax=Bufonid herpesvirus 1 TaxID=2282206 RepID=UPI000EB785A6|nr:hypothetical protein [Bufonid herpesvirus 1]AXF48565.1 hypothetical protein [Bufonid herpesvirus 1]